MIDFARRTLKDKKNYLFNRDLRWLSHQQQEHKNGLHKISKSKA